VRSGLIAGTPISAGMLSYFCCKLRPTNGVIEQYQDFLAQDLTSWQQSGFLFLDRDAEI
jgi:hypothetical protein